MEHIDRWLIRIFLSEGILVFTLILGSIIYRFVTGAVPQ